MGLTSEPRKRMTLTPRQHEVLRLVGRDQLTYRQAGDRLGIAEATVRNIARAVTAKSDLRGRTRSVLTRMYIDILEAKLAGRSR